MYDFLVQPVLKIQLNITSAFKKYQGDGVANEIRLLFSASLMLENCNEVEIIYAHLSVFVF